MQFAALGAALVDKVPWKEIIKSAPQLMDATRKLAESLSERKKSRTKRPTISEIQSRVEELESGNSRQAELVAEIATQVEAFSRGFNEVDYALNELKSQLETYSKRASRVIWVSATALVLAVLAVVLVFITS